MGMINRRARAQEADPHPLHKPSHIMTEIRGGQGLGDGVGHLANLGKLRRWKASSFHRGVGGPGGEGEERSGAWGAGEGV